MNLTSTKLTLVTLFAIVYTSVQAVPAKPSVANSSHSLFSSAHAIAENDSWFKEVFLQIRASFDAKLSQLGNPPAPRFPLQMVSTPPLEGTLAPTVLRPELLPPPPDCTCGPTCAGGQLGGQVWEDYNSDGVKSSVETNGVANISVTAYDCTGQAYGPVVTNSCGYYTFGASIAAGKYPVRIEFSNIPSIYNNSSTFNGTNSRTTVQKIATARCDANLGLTDPLEYCQQNPKVVVPQYVNGDPLPTTIGTNPCLGGNQNPASSAASLVSFPSNQTGNTPNPGYTTYSNAGQTGGVWGLAYQKKSKFLFSSAVLKRHVGLGSLGLGGIYITNTTTGVTSNFLKVSAVGVNVGNDANFENGADRGLPEERTCPNADKIGFDNVGKAGIGDIDVSDDGTKLFFTNLLDRRVYGLNIDPLNPTAATTTLYGSWLVPNTCGNPGDNRPWALKFNKGKLYVGTVCSQESSQSTAGLTATVFEINVAAAGSTPSQVLQFPLTFTKGRTDGACNVAQNQWKPWTLQFPNPCSGNWIIYPQPVLSDIEFDTNGDMIVGFLDRTGFQTGDENFSPNPETGAGGFNGFAGGDILRAQFNGVGSAWTIENNATVSCKTTAGANNNQGPGGGEYYYGDFSLFGQDPNGAWHTDAVQGGLALNPASGRVLVTGIDPSDQPWSGGVFQISNATGARDNGYSVYKRDPGTFGKAAGLGDLEVLCELPPLQIGNYVWLDTDGDGTQDPCETGLAGVNVTLYNQAGNQIATKQTDGSGEYYFSSSDGVLPNTKYFIAVGTGGQFSNGKITLGANSYGVTTADSGEGTNPDLNDSDGILNMPGAPAVVANFPTGMLTTGSEGSVNHTIDFGFAQCSVTATASKTDPKCGRSDGSATANPANGAAPYTYTWSNGGSTQTISNLAAGTYTVTIKDSYNCTVTASATLNNIAGPTATISKVDAKCGRADGSATANPAGGTAPYTYTWSNGGSSQSINNLLAGSYTVTVKDANLCTATATVNVGNIAGPTTTITKVDAKCGRADGSATAVPSGGTAPYTYTWSNGGASVTINNVLAGSYTVTVKDANLCTATATVTINNIDGPTASITKVDAKCGRADGSATANPTGGTTPYTYTWSNGATSQSINNVLAGTYTVTVRDANLCTAVATTTINNINGPSTTTTKVDAKCGRADGSATANPAGGTAPYTYTWSNGATSQSINNVLAGTYTVTVRDANLCTAVATTTINNINGPSTTITKVDAKCGRADGSATAVPSGGTAPYTYTWSNGGTSISINNVLAGSYTVTVKDANLCTATATVTINNINGPATTISKVDAKCGRADGSATANPTGGTTPYTYTWSNGATSQTINNVLAGSYTVTVKDANLCTATATVTINNINGPSTTITKVDAKCGRADGSATAVPAGGTAPYTYTWSNGGTTQSISNVLAGNYTVTVKDANLCTATETVTINNINGPSTTITKVDAKCGRADGSATAVPSGGTSPYTYTWSNGGTSQSINNVLAGSYSVTVKDANLCTATATVTINNINGPSTTITKVDAKCGRADGSATAVPAGGTTPYTYTWSNGATSQTIAGVIAGSYTVTVKDANLCTATATVTIGTIAGPTATITKVDAKCGRPDGSATAVPSGGTSPYTYTWSNGVFTQTINNVLAGTYTVTVKDANQCTAVATVTINNINGPTTTITKVDAKCGRADGSATAVPSGGTAPYTYTWSNGASSQTISNVLAGSYTVTVKDANLCTATATVTINNINGPATTISKVDAKCGRADGSATANPTGGTSPYTYTWSNGATSQTINNVLAGSYTVTVKDANLCTAIATVTINNINGPTTIITKVDAKCGRADGSATAVPSGGTAPYTYTWSNGATSQSISNVLAGNYTVTVKDANLCTVTETVTINNINGPSVTITRVDAKCGRADGSATAVPSGGTSPYTYTWSNGGTSQSISNVLAGSYTVTVKDANLCTATATVTINNISGPSTTITKVDAKCGRADGSATAVPAGGTTPYTYTWSNGATSQTIAGVIAGSYTVTVKDANLCTATATVTLINIAGPTTTITKVDAKCDRADGSATAVPAGGTSPYTYTWSNGVFTQTINNVVAGTYTVTVKDANQCTALATVTINNINGPSTTISKVDAKCGRADGSATAVPAGGTTPYTYTWSNGATSQTINNVSAGNYTVTVRDANLCTATATVTINNINGPNTTITKVDAKCGRADGSATAVPSGGTTPYTYTWSNGGTNISINNVLAGSYTVTVRDANLCTATATVTINNINGPSTTITKVDAKCGRADGSATAVPVGGTTPYTYMWSNGGTIQTISNLLAGTYTVTVKDANLCTATATVTINNINGPSTTITKVDAKCGRADGSATAVPAGGTTPYTYIWSNGGTFQSISNVLAGTYTVTVKDANQCTATATVTLNNIDGPSATITKVDAKCGRADGSATANPTGGTTPYTYTWSNGATSQTINNVVSGTYSVTVRDANLCTATGTVNINNINGPSTTITKVDAKCGRADGSATANPTGGTTPYTFTWSTGATSQSINNVLAGTYTVTVKDVNLCTATATVTIDNISGPAISITKVDPNCEQANGSINLTVSNGTAPYTYIWSNGSVSQDLNNLPAGDYFVTVTDANQCKAFTQAPVVLAEKGCVFDLALIKKKKVGQSSTVAPGDLVTFTVFVYNQGTVTGKNIQIADYIPNGLTLVPGNGWTAVGSTASLDAPIAVLAPGANTTRDITFIVNAGFSGQAVNRAEISSAENQNNYPDIDSKPDAINGNDAGGLLGSPADNYLDGNGTGLPGDGVAITDEDDEDPADPITVATFDLALIKTLKVGQPATVSSGDIVNFTITVTNQGSLNATQVQISDYLPVGMTLIPNGVWTVVGTTATLQIPITNLAPGASVSREISFKVDPNFEGQIINRAEISSSKNIFNIPDVDSKPDAINGNDAGGLLNSPADDYVFGDGTGATGNGNAATDEDDEDPAAIFVGKFDLALIKKLATGQAVEVSPGDNVKFTISVVNQGTITGTNIQVTDYIPSGFTLVPDATWIASGANAVLITPIASLAPGATVTRDITLKVNEGVSGDVVNRAEISAASNAFNLPDQDSKPDAINGNDAGGKVNTPADNALNGNGTGALGDGNAVTDEDDEDPASVLVNTFDLALIKTLKAGQSASVSTGDNVVFTITVVNQGTIDATNIQLSDYVPAGLSLLPANGWTLTGSTATLNTPIALLAAGQTVTREISFRVNAGAVGQLVNRAEISAASNFSNLPDIDSKPDNNPTNDAGGKENSTSDNVLTGNGTGVPGDTNPVTDEDDADPAVINVGLFDLALVKKLKAGATSYYAPGEVVTFEVTVYNQGTVAGKNIVVTDYIPTGLTLVAGPNWTAGVNTATLTNPIPVLNPGANTTLEISFRVNAGVNGTVVNRAEISAASNDLNLPDIDSKPDATRGNDAGGLVNSPADNFILGNGKGVAGDGVPLTDEDDEDPAGIIVATFDVALIKTLKAGQPSNVAAGDDVTFTISIVNQGTIPATNIQVTDYIPTGLTLTPNTTWIQTGSTASLATVIPILNPGQTITRDITFKVANGVNGVIVNRAEISAASNTYNLQDVDSKPDAIQGNDAGGQANSPADNALNGNGTGVAGDGNAATDEDDEDPAVVNVSVYDAALTKMLAPGQNPSVMPGENVQYTITVYNQGTEALTNIKVVDYVPAGMSYVSTPGWNLIGGLPTTTIAGPLSPGASTSVGITLKVDANFTGTSIVNRSEISEIRNTLNVAVNDVDSKPDTNPSNDGGGKEETPSDDAINGNGTGTPGDSNAATDEDDADPAIVRVNFFDLALVKKLAAGQSSIISAGDNVTYTLTVYNQGNVPASQIMLTDYVPVGMTFVSSPGWFILGGRPTTQLPGVLAPGASTSINLTLRVNPTFVGTVLRNFAEISSAKDGSGNTVTDVDSTPDTVNGNGSGEQNPKNDEVTENGKNGGDEDDHDYEDITTIQCSLAITAVAPEICSCVNGSADVTVNVTWGASAPNKVINVVLGAQTKTIDPSTTSSPATVVFNNVVGTNGTVAVEYIDGSCPSTKGFTIVKDTEKPTFTGVPVDKTIECREILFEQDPIIKDNCTKNVPFTFRMDTIPASCGFTIQCIWTATDNCGNVATAVQSVTVKDTKKPYVLNPPSDITIECGDQIPGYTPNWKDDCDNTLTLTAASSVGILPCGEVQVFVYRAEDDCGNNASVAYNVTILDRKKPVVINPPTDITIECGDQIPPYVPEWEDVCDKSLTLTAKSSVALLACGEEQVYVYSASDDCGNAASVTRKVTILDSKKPFVINPPTDITVECGNPIPPYVPQWDDICDKDLTLSAISSISKLNCGFIEEYVYFAKDDCGNEGRVVRKITILDTKKPVLVGCPVDVTVECNQVPLPANVTASDQCTTGIPVAYKQVRTDGTCADSYVLTRTWEVADDCGNNTSCSQVITVRDTKAPVLAGCPANITVECDAVPAPATPTATDNCDTDVTITYNQTRTPGQCADSYTLTRVWTATDNCNNSSTCSQVITVRDTKAPVLAGCPANITVECDAVPAPATPTATDNCDTDVTITYNQTRTPGQCADSYTLTRVWTATDNCNNSSTCSQVITVRDTKAPVLVGCPANITVECDAVPAPATPTAADNCDADVTITYNQTRTPGQCADSYTLTRVWTATDNCNNSSTCSQVITVRDTKAPVLAGCPANITVECDAVPAPATPTATDNCDADVTITYNQTRTPGQCADSYTLTRVWTATDNCNNSSTCSQVITVRDTKAPVLAGCPANITVECDAVPAPATPTATDNCDADVTITYNQTRTPGQCADSYTLTRVWTATDNCNNSSTCSQVITVRDTKAPVLAGCPANITVECDAVPAPATPTATDNCDTDVTITYNQTRTPGQCADSYTLTRVWTATDNCNNSSTCSQVITVRDTKAPVLAGCPANITVECDAVPAPATPTATDNCDNAVTITYNQTRTPGQCADSYTLTRVWTATDNCNNSSTCSQVITVRDTKAPVLAGCPANITVECDAVPAPATPTATDNCDADVTITYNQTRTPGQCADSYTLTRIWTATDNCNNSSTCSQVITVRDTKAPVLAGCPANITVECDAVPAPATPTATDNCDTQVTVTLNETKTPGICGGTYTLTRVWTATDNCNNSSTCSQVISVIDNKVPVLVGCPANVTVECDAIPAPATPTATDNCDAQVNVLYTETKTTGTCADYYTLTRRWTATDNCGNRSTCSQVISVIDTKAPVLVGCPANVTVECNAVPTPATPTATDNCDKEVNITYNETKTAGTCADAYTLTRLWRATDNCGNAATCTQVITVRDTKPPVVTFVPADVTLNCTDNLPPVGTPTGTDNCASQVTVVYKGESKEALNCPGNYKVIRTWELSDNCNNITTAKQTLTIKDSNLPTFTSVPSNVTVECDAIPAVVTPTATDECSQPVTVVYNGETKANGTCKASYQLTRRWTASDACGNTASTSQVITVRDTKPPVFTVKPTDLSVTCNDTLPGLPVLTASDNCDDNVEILVAITTQPGTCNNNFVVIRTFTATDDCGNTATHVQRVSVGDNTPPTFVNFPADVNSECSNGNIPVPTVTAVDNCDPKVVTNITFKQDSVPGNCKGSYTLIRTWTATDLCGNSVSKSQTVKVGDATPPVIAGIPQDVTVECSEIPVPGNPTATDNCGNATIKYNGEVRTTVICIDGYTLERSWTATDDCGNSVTKTQNIYVRDRIAPVSATPTPDVTVECGNIPNIPSVIFVDNCDKEVTIFFRTDTIKSGCNIIYRRTWTALDNCGNRASKVQNITVIDNSKPVFVLPLPQDVTIECKLPVPPAPTVTATDNCNPTVTVAFKETTKPGSGDILETITRTWTATDLCGNSSVHTQTITRKCEIFDLALLKKVKAGQPSTFVAGDVVKFEIEVSNQGNVGATQVNVVDYVPVGLILQDANWTLTAGKARLNTPIASIPAGGKVTVDITFQIDPTFTGGKIRNLAEISSTKDDKGNTPTDKDSTPDDTDGNQNGEKTPTAKDGVNTEDGKNGGDEDDHDGVNIDVNPKPVFDLALLKKVKAGQPSTFVAGDVVKFEIEVSNQGNVGATQVNVVDYVPAGLILQDANWTLTAGKARLNTPIASIPAGGKVTVDITFQIDPTFAGGKIRNLAEISSTKDDKGNTPTDKDSTPDDTDGNQNGEKSPTAKDGVNTEDGKNGGDEDDHDGVNIDVNPKPVFDLALLKKVKAGQPSTFVAGDVVKFEIEVSNQGNVGATQVNVVDYVPVGLILQDANWTLTAGKARLNTPIASIPAGGKVTVEITFQIDPTFAGGKIRNLAEISSAKDDKGNTPTDKDSTPDDTDGNQNGEKSPTAKDGVNTEDGKTGGDEDDHDGSTIDVKALCVTPGFTASAVMVSCVKGVLQVDGRLCVSNITGNPVKAGYSEGTTYTGPSFGAAPAIPVGGCIVTNLPDPGVAKIYTIRLYVTADCFRDVQVTLRPNTDCKPDCTQPTYTATATKVSCIDGVLQSDGKICISNVSANATKAGYSEGFSYTGPSFALASGIPAGGCLVTNLPNPTAAKAYTIRVFVDADCYFDQIVTLVPNTDCIKECVVPTYKATVTNVTCTNGQSNDDGKICLSNWSANSNKAGISIGTVYTGPNFAAANPISASGCLLVNISNPSTPVFYTIRVYESATCFKDTTVRLLSISCKDICTKPSFNATATSVTCVGGVPQADGKICISNVSANGIKVGYSAGSTYAGPTFAAAATLPTSGCIVTNLTNPTAAKQYTVRVFASEDCFEDVVVTLLPNNDCKPVCDLSIKEVTASKCVCANNPNDKVGISVTIDWKNVPSGQKIVVKIGNQTKVIDPAAVVSPTVVVFDLPASTTQGVVEVAYENGTCASTKSFTVTSSVDNVPPVITFKNKDLNAIASGDTMTFDCSNPPNFGLADAIVSDNCDANPTLEFVDVAVKAGNCPVDGYLFIMHCKYVATDKCGNKTEFHFYVKIQDKNKPVITAPKDVTVACENIPVVGKPMIFDACDDNVVITFKETSTISSCKGSYKLTRTWLATDHCGNTANATQVITVVDDKAPVFTTNPTDVTINQGDNPPSASLTATDNCSAKVNITLKADTTYKGCDYTVVRTWVATDDCGNASTKQQTIKVLGKQPIAGKFDVSNVGDLCLNGVTVVVNGSASGNTVPAGYAVAYLLTSDPNLTVRQVSTTPSFTIGTAGAYKIHVLVYNPATLNLSAIVPNVSKGGDLLSLLTQGGGSICGALNATGTGINVIDNCCTEPIITDLELKQPGCNANDGKATIISPNAAQYKYTWLPNLGTPVTNLGNSRINLPAGNYQVIVADANNPNCFKKISFTLVPGTSCKDTVYVVTNVNTPADTCIKPVLNLSGPITSAAVCQNGKHVKVTLSQNSDCIKLVPDTNFVGKDTLCIIHCSGTTCDTTIVVITVKPVCTDLIAETVFKAEAADCNGKAGICLPLTAAQIADYQVLDNGVVYSAPLIGCEFDSTYVYLYQTLPGAGKNGPYMLTEWKVNNSTFAGKFANPSTLRDSMNKWDAGGNWTIDTTSLTIKGGKAGSKYGIMKIDQQGTSGGAMLQPNISLVAKKVSISLGVGQHVVKFVNKLTGCQDSITVTVTCPVIKCEDLILAKKKTLLTSNCAIPAEFCFEVPLSVIETQYSITDNGTNFTAGMKACVLNGTPGTALLLKVGNHFLVFTNKATGCKDTVDVKVTCIQTNVISSSLVVGQRDTFKLDIAEMQGKVVGVKRIPVAGSAGEYADIQLIDGSYSIVCEAIEEGTDAVSFVLVDQDGIADTTRIEVKVYSRAATPTAVDDQVRIAKNTVAMIYPEQNDVLVGKTNVVRLLSAPAHGTVQVMKDGMVMYTPNANFAGKDELVYELCNEAGCAQARILFSVEGNGMVVYNAFSPNGDGTNDSFTIQNIEQYPNNELQIFNRWGEAILNVKGYKNDWKGTWNDKDLPDGTYFYILEDGFGNKNSGFIELKR